MNFEGLKNYITGKLRNELRPTLFYHDLAHTQDVYHSAIRLAESEGITGEEMILLKTAALLHDAGMLKTYVGHEKAGTEIANDLLPDFGYSPEHIRQINKMIMATQLPQNGTGLLEKVLCDADLDYLGRDDFFMIAHRLKLEWNLEKFKPTTLLEWYFLQIDFLSRHRYYTRTAIDTREEKKQQNLLQIKEIMAVHSR